MKRELDLLFKGVDTSCRIILGLLTLTVLNTVFGRYVLNMTPRWGEEVALSLLIWLSLIAVPLGIRNGWHIRLDLLHRAVGPRAQTGLNLVNWLISLGIALMFVWFGTAVAIQKYPTTMPGLGISAFWQYVSVPISGLLMIIALAESFLSAGNPPAGILEEIEAND